MATVKAKRKALHSAVNHNADKRAMGSCIHHYMGSMAMFSLVNLLNGTPERGFDTSVIDTAREKDLDAGIAYCIKHGYLGENWETTIDL